MKKMAFIGIILLAGLFSLQFILVGPRSENIVHQNIEIEQNDTLFTTSTLNKLEVVYICPSDSVLMQNIERAKTRLL